jgi:hypothetical protein
LRTNEQSFYTLFTSSLVEQIYAQEDISDAQKEYLKQLIYMPLLTDQ